MKKKSIILSVLGAVLLGTALTGCGSKATNTTVPQQSTEAAIKIEDAESSTEAEAETEARTTAAAGITFEPEIEETKADDGTTILYSVCQTPVVTISSNQAAADAINKEIQNASDAFWIEEPTNQTYAKDNFAGADEYFWPDTDSVLFDVTRNDTSVISFCVTKSIGATTNDNSYRAYPMNFDANTGALLSFSDLTTDEAAFSKEVDDYLSGETYSEDSFYFSKAGLNVKQDWTVLTVPYDVLTSLKPEYLYNGNLERPVKLSETFTKDLDGNGSDEDLNISITTNEEEYISVVTMTVNGTDFSDVITDNDIMLSDNYLPSYYVTDLDTSDSFYEFAITDCGYSDCATTHFFRYENDAVTYLGAIPSRLDNNVNCHTNGDGTISCPIRLNIFETASAPAAYVLGSDGKLTLSDQKWFYPIPYIWNPYFETHTLLQDVTVYTDADTASETKVLTAADGPFTFPATDNKNWFQIQTADGDIYYMHFDDFSTIDSNGTKLDSNETITPIFLAG